MALGVPFRGLVGVVLSNELLDAFPVHRIRMQRDRLQEVYVALEGERLVETEGPLSTPRLKERLARVCASLEDGWEAEVNLEIDTWMAEVAQALDQGYVLTIDYGRPAAELVRPVSCDKPLVETTIIESKDGIAITLVNWSSTPAMDLRVTIAVGDKFSKITTASGEPVSISRQAGRTTATLDLAVADVLILR